MSLKKLMTSISAVAVLALLSQPASESNADNALATTNVIAVNANGDDTVRQSDFDGDGTIGFGDFVKFAAKFGLSQGDVGYDAQFDLNDDAEIGFADYLIFVENFGKEVAAPGVEVANTMYWTDTNAGKDTAVQPRRQRYRQPRHHGIGEPTRYRVGRGRRQNVLDGRF